MELLQEYNPRLGETVRFYADNETHSFVLELEKPWEQTQVHLEYGTAFLLGKFITTSIENCSRVWASDNKVNLTVP